MSGPRRWKDDPEIRGSGLDLGDEALLVGTYDLDRVRRGVEARTGASPGPGGGSAIASGAVAAGLGLAALAMLALWSSGSPEADVVALVDDAVAAGEVPPLVPPKPSVAPTEPVPLERVEAAPVAAPVQPAPVGAAPVGAAPIEPGPIEVAPVEAAPVDAAPVQSAPEPDFAEPTDAIATADERAAEPPPGELGAEIAAIREARAALDAGDAAGALAGYRAYLVRWPDGHLRQEALVAVLESLVALESWDAAAQVAARLAAAPELEPRRPDILRARADALVRLDRCDDALALVDQLARADAASLRQRCRKAR